MYKKQYITDEEKTNCQKVADAFAEIYEDEDFIVLNAGKYGFVKLQYFKFPFGFDNADIFYDSRSLFDELWEEWLDTQILNIAGGTPMEETQHERQRAAQDNWRQSKTTEIGIRRQPALCC